MQLLPNITELIKCELKRLTPESSLQNSFPHCLPSDPQEEISQPNMANSPTLLGKGSQKETDVAFTLMNPSICKGWEFTDVNTSFCTPIHARTEKASVGQEGIA